MRVNWMLCVPSATHQSATHLRGALHFGALDVESAEILQLIGELL